MLTLQPDELVELTGYRQPSRQTQWLRDKLRLAPPLRPDGSPVVTRAQVEAALAGKHTATKQPKWSVSA